jgi:hypothetical protein
MAEWASDSAFSVRAGVLETGVLAGTVTSNGGHNTLLGQADLDLFFGRNNDTTDLAANEVFVKI